MATRNRTSDPKFFSCNWNLQVDSTWFSFFVIPLSSHGQKVTAVVPSILLSSGESRKERDSILSKKNIFPKAFSAHLSQVPNGQDWVICSFSGSKGCWETSACGGKQCLSSKGTWQWHRQPGVSATTENLEEVREEYIQKCYLL